MALVLCLAALIPAQAAGAQVLSGYTSKVDYDNTDPERYMIEIDLTNQIITVYERASGSIVLLGLCTTGSKKTPTGAGTYKLGNLKERFGYFVAYGQYAQYWSQVVRGVYIHSVMYDTQRLSSLSRSAYNGLGKALSHGCVRVLPEHAKWIFYNCPPGTTCVITRNKAQNPALVAALKESLPAYANYVHPMDEKADPDVLPARVIRNEAPLMTGFSSKDKTVRKLAYGDCVDILQLGPDWCKLRTSDGKLGYVKTQYLLVYPDEPVITTTVYQASAKTYLYANAETGSQKLATIAKNAQVNVTGVYDASWYTAVVNGVSGYVHARDIKASAGLQYPALSTDAVSYTAPYTAPETVPAPQPNAAGTAADAYVRADIIANLRSGPGTGYPVTGELVGGTPLRILKKNGSWYQIEANGIRGYISKTCVG